MIGHGLVPQYETLRGGALGNPVDPSARAGLTILLCRGMWAWARTLAAGLAPQPAPAVPVAPSVLDASRELARLLADMTLASIRRSP